jgi:hypothetical protein
MRVESEVTEANARKELAFAVKEAKILIAPQSQEVRRDL